MNYFKFCYHLVIDVSTRIPGVRPYGAIEMQSVRILYGTEPYLGDAVMRGVSQIAAPRGKRAVCATGA